jgi:hypothetical protein
LSAAAVADGWVDIGTASFVYKAANGHLIHLDPNQRGWRDLTAEVLNEERLYRIDRSRKDAERWANAILYDFVKTAVVGGAATVFSGGSITIGVIASDVITGIVSDAAAEFDRQFPVCAQCNGISVADTPEIPTLIYRDGGTNPANLTPRPQDEGKLSFRDSLSNPYPMDGKPVLGSSDVYIEVDTSKLPPGSVIPDGGTNGLPVGHVSVKDVSPQVLKENSRRMKWPKRH